MTVLAAHARLWLTAALDLVYPAVCPVCREALGDDRRAPLCGDCWRSIVRIAPPWCGVCGLGLPRDVFGVATGRRVCGPCTVEAPPFEWARVPAVYAGALREAIHAFKFAGRRTLVHPLAALVIEQLATELPADVDALVPVPLGAARQRERGFNQALLIAEDVGRALDLPVRPRWLQRARATAPQADLTASERRRNVRDAFRASPAVQGRHVVVVDDVFTTGATAGECARALHRAGAHAVGIVAVARVV